MITYMTRMFEELRKNKKFPDTWKESDIKWIYKKGSRLEMKNYRPIALSNTLSKIFTKILTNRLEQVVEGSKIIGEEQQGFRVDRSCAAAVLILKTLMARANKNKKPFYLACLDIHKAYDNVNHKKLWEICEKMGLGGEWLKCVKELYNNGKIRGIGSTKMTKWVPMKKGIRQGCPMSPLLFAIYTGIVTLYLKQYMNIKSTEPSMLMYADDMVVWGNTEEEFQKKLQLIMEAFDNLGLTLSNTKSELQYNKWVPIQDRKDMINIEHNKKSEELKFFTKNKGNKISRSLDNNRWNSRLGIGTIKAKTGIKIGKNKQVKGTSNIKGKYNQRKNIINMELYSNNTRHRYGGNKYTRKCIM